MDNEILNKYALIKIEFALEILENIKTRHLLISNLKTARENTDNKLNLLFKTM